MDYTIHYVNGWMMQSAMAPNADNNNTEKGGVMCGYSYIINKDSE